MLGAINGAGYEDAVPGMAERGNIPLLQDTAAANVWGAWAAAYRDVVILDRENRRIAVFNLTVHDLGQPDQYAALKQLLVDALR
ncbi:hypothetical protein L6R52_31265 [Myxococcota bacterium]|nr:hypothetical protein [Myxococcota bacterium]